MEIILLAIVSFLIFKFKILRSLISLFKKSDAATAVQNLLEHQRKFGFFDGDTGLKANEFIQAAWNDKPDIFNGKFGKRPHKISVVIYSLALATLSLDATKDKNISSVMLAFGSAISEVETNGRYYQLNNIDHALVDEAMQMAVPIMSRFEN